MFDIRTLNDNKSSFSELLIGGESNGTDKVLKTATSNDNLNIATKGTGDITLKAGEDVTTLNSANDTASTVYADRFRHREAFYDNGNQGATFNPDINNGNVQQATLTNNITINNIQNIARGQSLTLILIQDSTGGRLSLIHI